MCNQKGGVGKTTSTINLGAALVEFGRKVLLIDLDPQGALSVGLGVPAQQLDRTVYNALMERRTTLADVTVPTDIPGLDLVPSNIDLSAAEVQLVSEVAREQTLMRVLSSVRDDYDYILIDCQPSLGLLTVNALTAAHGVVIPLECEFFSLRGVALLVDTIDKVKERLNPRWRSPASSPRCTTRDRALPRGVQPGRRGLRRHRLPTVIQRTVRFPETTVAGQPITTWAPHLLRRRRLPRPGQGGHRTVTRRPVLPGAAELFRRTDTPPEAEVTELPSLSSAAASPSLRSRRATAEPEPSSRRP
jgi:chromosome partitioning protein